MQVTFEKNYLAGKPPLNAGQHLLMEDVKKKPNQSAYSPSDTCQSTHEFLQNNSSVSVEKE